MIYNFSKSVKSERQEIEKLISKAEGRFRKAFLEYIASLKTRESLIAVRKFLEQNDINGLVEYFNNKQKPFTAILAAVVLEAGEAEVVSLKPKVQRKLNRLTQNGLPRPSVGIQFEIANERAASLLREQTGNISEKLNERQSELIRGILSDAQLEGETGSRRIAQLITNDIGLTKNQSDAVKNYEALLRAGNKESLTRGLRDRRSDSKIRNGVPLEEKQIQRMVNSYRARYEKYRANAIARTTGGQAVAAARQEAFVQSLEQSGIDPQDAIRTWRKTNGDKTRDTHSAMDNQKVGVLEPFVSPSGSRLMQPLDASLGAPAEEIIHCGCIVTHEIRD